jgi:hypothetical protein
LTVRATFGKLDVSRARDVSRDTLTTARDVHERGPTNAKIGAATFCPEHA